MWSAALTRVYVFPWIWISPFEFSWSTPLPIWTKSFFITEGTKVILAETKNKDLGKIFA